MFSLRVCVDDFVFRWRVLELLVHEEMNWRKNFLTLFCFNLELFKCYCKYWNNSLGVQYLKTGFSNQSPCSVNYKKALEMLYSWEMKQESLIGSAHFILKLQCPPWDSQHISSPKAWVSIMMHLFWLKSYVMVFVSKEPFGRTIWKYVGKTPKSFQFLLTCLKVFWQHQLYEVSIKMTEDLFFFFKIRLRHSRAVFWSYSPWTCYQQLKTL